MPLWGTSEDAATNKPKWLPDDANSDYDVTAVRATNSGWVRRPGTAATGNDNASAQEEILVALGGLAGTSTSTGIGRPTITRFRWGQSAYTGAVAITVEGSNIMTRSLIHFGQGAIRCHPYSYKELKALMNNDVKEFDYNFFKHIFI